MQLAADAGLLHLARLHANAGCRHALASEGACCTNEALQGWCAVQGQVPELRDAAGCECRLAAGKETESMGLVDGTASGLPVKK